MTSIQFIVPASGKVLEELTLRLAIELLKLQPPVTVSRVDAVLPQPPESLVPPAFEHISRNRIVSPPRDETDRPGLRPMRQPPLDHREFGIRIKTMQVCHAFRVAVIAPRDEPLAVQVNLFIRLPSSPSFAEGSSRRSVMASAFVSESNQQGASPCQEVRV